MTTLTGLDLDAELALLLASADPIYYLAIDGPGGHLTSSVPLRLDNKRAIFLGFCHPDRNCAALTVHTPGIANRVLIYNGDGPYADTPLSATLTPTDKIHIQLHPDGHGQWRNLR